MFRSIFFSISALLLLSVLNIQKAQSQAATKATVEIIRSVQEAQEEINVYSCDHYPNLSQHFSETLEGFAADLDEQDPDRNNHINLMASLLWQCSNDAQEYNNILLDTLEVYFTEPRMKTHIIQLLDALAPRYEAVETHNEANNTWNRSVFYGSWAAVVYVGARWILRRAANRYTRVSRLLEALSTTIQYPNTAAASIIAGGSLVTGAVVEMNEDDLNVKMDPSILIASLAGIEMYELQNRACQLEKDLKITEITDQEHFDELALTHKNLSSSYNLLAEEAPRFIYTQDLVLPHEELIEEEEVYTEFDNSVHYDWWKKPVDPNDNCRKNNSINLNMAGCYLEESARILNDSSFSTEPIRFGSPFSRCSLSITPG